MTLSAPTAKTPWKNDDCGKILCIEGFCRKNGNTQALLNKFLSDYVGFAIKRYNTFEKNPKPCIGCDFCSKDGACRFRDLDDFFYFFETADIVVFASPVYNLSFPAPLKALLDRLQPYYNGFFSDERKQRIKKKRNAYFLATAGQDGALGFDIMERQLKNIFSVTNIKYMGGSLVGNTDNTTPKCEL